jgi:hypothetical protein
MSEANISMRHTRIQLLMESSNKTLQLCLKDTNEISRAQTKCSYLETIIELEMEKLELTKDLCLADGSSSATVSIEDMDRYGLSCDTVNAAQDRLTEATLDLTKAQQEMQYLWEHS